MSAAKASKSAASTAPTSGGKRPQGVELLLLRHAEAADKAAGSNDFQRDLTPKGQRQAERIGRLLAHRALHPDLVVTSPANRALQTAHLACGPLGIPVDHVREDPSMYENDVPDLLDAIRRHAGKAKRLMLVGHNPSFSSLAAFLSGKESFGLGKGEAVLLSGAKDWSTVADRALHLEHLKA